MSLLSENIRFLRNQKEISQQKLADDLIITRAAFSKYEEGKSEPPLSVLSRITKYFHVSIDIMISVDLKKTPIDRLLKMADNRILLPIIVDKEQNNSIEIIPIKAKAGYFQGYSDPEFIESLPRMHLPFLNSAKHRAFPVEGDSMPPHKNSSFIVARYLENFQEVKDNRTYIVLSRTEGVVYKRLFKKNEHTFVFKSDNSAYQAYEVKMEEILEIWEYACSFCTTEFSTNDIGIVDFGNIIMSLQTDIKEMKAKLKTL